MTRQCTPCILGWPNQNHYLYFANTPGNLDVPDIDWTQGRLRVSNSANVTYPSGNLRNTSFGVADGAFDAIFAAEFSSVPEPTRALLVSDRAGAGPVPPPLKAEDSQSWQPARVQ